MTYRVLVSGAGGAGRQVAQCMAADGRGQPVAFFEPVPGQHEKVSAQFPEAAVGDDYAALLDAAQPDVVVVAGPDHLHAQQAIEALGCGCHVLVEKPMATSVADARRLRKAELAAGRHLAVDFTMRYVHPWGTMARAARDGQVGRVFFVQGNYIHDMWAWYDAQGPNHTPWRVDPDHPQEILLGGGCHAIDLMLWVTRDLPVQEVFCYANHLSGSDLPADDCLLVGLRYADGTTGKVFVTSGCNGAPFGRFLEVFGIGGTLLDGKLYRRDAEPLALEDDAGHESAGGHGWPGAVRDFLDTLDGKRANPLPWLHGARNVALCEAALQSVWSGSPEPVEWFEDSGGEPQ